ncbi:MAG TPA: bacillithiol biosynthesis BshC [Thermoanaerobaculia bacterium]|nr:bacillithiol biosynthesis BshC [Thermoanaerobaculia bacterium]
MTTATEPACLQLSLADYPGMNPFVLDWMNGKVDALLPRSVGGEGGRRPDEGASPDLVNALIESNKRWGLFVRDEVERWARGESVALIAGQQVGFAGGPLYTLAKLASLLKLKKQFPNATVFFWLATEDHDFDEAATLSLPVANNQLDLMHIAVSHAVDSKAMVGPQLVPEPLIADLLAQLQIPRPSWLREGITFRDSFAELIAHVFAHEKIVLVDALLPELRRAGAALFHQIAKRAGEVQSALAARSSALAKAGYVPQVVPREGDGYTLFFRIDEHGNREVMQAPFDIGDPATISTSALTRPLLQDYVFRPAVFMGGPSEVAYYAQIAPLHDLLGIPLPRVALRGHALVAPKRVTRAFQRYQLEPREVFRNADEILAEREPESVARVRKLSEEGKRELLARIAEIGDIALPAEHALARAINRSIGHIEYHFNKLSERAIKGLARKDRERLLAVRELVATLFPDRHVQDRVVGWIPFFCRYDGLLIERMIDEIEPDAPVCRIIAL